VSEKNNVFLITRPLQYLNIKGIVEKKSCFNNILVIIPNFPNSKRFLYDVIKYDQNWSKVLIIKSKIDLLIFVIKTKINNLYLNSDLAFNYLITFFSNSNKTYVYEEGWGTYNSEISHINKLARISQFIYGCIGSGKAMGHSIFTDGIYVYNINLYKKIFPNYNKKIKSFKSNFQKRIITESNFFQKIHDYKSETYNVTNKNVLIYATGWKINNKFLNNLKEMKGDYDKIYLKLHPHIKNYKKNDFCFSLLSQNVLLEFYLAEFISQNNNVTVYHDNSFSILNFINDINEFNIGRKRVKYDEIYELFKNDI
jgi:hypothetical protein